MGNFGNGSFLKLTLGVMLLAFFSCKKDNDDDGTDNPTGKTFNLAASIVEGGETSVYLAPVTNLKSGSLTFVNNGYELPAANAARVVSMGDYTYSLNYGTGIISQYKNNSTGGYDLIKEIDGGTAVGTKTPRYKAVNNNYILVHNVSVATEYEPDGTTIKSVTPTMTCAVISIPDLVVVQKMEPFIIPQTAASRAEKLYGFRIDAPVVASGKVYYGLMRTVNGIGRGGIPGSGMETVVMDFPSLANPQVIRSDVASGHTNGYRTPSMHVDENGAIYQSNQFMALFGFDLTAGDNTVITKLVNGAYDPTYVFNVSEALTDKISTAGWFYVGNGIGYMPIILEDVYESGADNYWSLARIDLNQKTAVKLNVPLSNLLEYQSAVVNDGKFYMAISPIGGEAYVYEFDPAFTSPDAFTKGLKLDDGNIFIQGIY